MMYPDYQRVDNPERARARKSIGRCRGEARRQACLTVVEVIKRSGGGKVKGMDIMGENSCDEAIRMPTMRAKRCRKLECCGYRTFS